MGARGFTENMEAFGEDHGKNTKSITVSFTNSVLKLGGKNQSTKNLLQGEFKKLPLTEMLQVKGPKTVSIQGMLLPSSKSKHTDT